MSICDLVASTTDYVRSSMVVTRFLMFFLYSHPYPELFFFFLIFLPLKSLCSKSHSLEAGLLARKGKVIAHLLILLGCVPTFYWWPLEN